jgi:diaminopimelate epimerase
LAPSVVGYLRQGVVQFPRRKFWKMTGSGNDFVFFDARIDPAGPLESAEAIGAICDRRRGIGADGIVLLENDPEHAYSIRYFNRDGSLAEFCGNASLCSVTLATELGAVPAGELFTFRTSSGPIPGRSTGHGPQVGMPAVSDRVPAFTAELEAGEQRIGFARVGVPHLIVACANVDDVDVANRGRQLRHHPRLPAGANVNFVSRLGSDWTYRTYERGVEEETLACGSGSVATAAMLVDWMDATGPIRLLTRSGAPLTVGFENGSSTLSGEGRLVAEGTLMDVAPLP